MFNQQTRKAHELSLLDPELSLLKALYDESIKLSDEQIGIFLREMEDLNIMDKTYIIITSDHGQQFLEHGDFGHGLYLYDEIVRVPLIMVGPNIPTQTYHHPASLLDLAPTMLDLMGIHRPCNFWGQNLLSNQRKFLIIEESRRKRNDVIMEEGRILLDTKMKKTAIRTDGYKYIYDIDRGEEELYDLLQDPQEHENISQNNKDICEKMKINVIKHTEFEKEICRMMHKIDSLRTHLENPSKDI